MIEILITMQKVNLLHDYQKEFTINIFLIPKLYGGSKSQCKSKDPWEVYRTLHRSKTPDPAGLGPGSARLCVGATEARLFQLCTGHHGQLLMCTLKALIPVIAWFKSWTTLFQMSSLHISWRFSLLDRYIIYQAYYFVLVIYLSIL